mgnify:CR=1 FL=1
MDEQALLDKLRKIEALIAQPGTRGEGRAAAEARRRLMERLAAVRFDRELLVVEVEMRVRRRVHFLFLVLCGFFFLSWLPNFR